MMIPPFDYKIPTTVEEAVDLLWKAGGKAKIIAGGTDLIISLRNGGCTPPAVIDITRIEDLQKIEEKNGEISIGAAVTHSEIVASPIVRKYGKVLSDAASEIGSPQIRNLGTIGGNIVNASPAADTLPPLMVLNATGTVASREGEKEVPLSQLFKGPYESNLKPHELLVRITFEKLSSDMKSGFARLARREAMAIARMSVAVVLQVGMEKNRIEIIRIAAGSVTPTPRRMSEAEAILTGRSPDEETLKQAAIQVSQAMVRRSGIRPSTSYKKPVVESMVIRTIKKALEEQL